MGIQTCAPDPFQGTQQFMVPFSTSILSIVRTTVPLVWTMTILRRPSVPLWGVKSNVDGGYDFLPSTKANAKTLVDIAVSAYNASVNYDQNRTDDTLFPDQYAPINGINYGDYLYRKISADTCLISRYIEVYNKTAQFFRLHAAIGAFDITVYKELQVQQNAIQAEIDKQMMIPPGIYSFGVGSAANASLETWFGADATLSGLYALEVTTT